jgi:uncharacterized protein YwgA
MANAGELLGLLSLIHASGGEVETRIRLQKQVYLLSLKYPDLFDSSDFEYHHYGPYSRFLSENLQFAVSSGLIDEIDETPQDQSFTKYRYVLTESGKAAVEQNPFNIPEFELNVLRLKDENWRTLELAATIRFLELKEKLPREAAIEKAQKLKPATVPFVAQAVSLLAA